MVIRERFIYHWGIISNTDLFRHTVYFRSFHVQLHGRFSDFGIVVVTDEITSLCNDMFMVTGREPVDPVIAS